MGDAVEFGLVDEPLARVRLAVGIIAYDVDAGFERLAQYRRDRDRVVGGEEDAIDARGDVAVDDLDLIVDIGFGGRVGGDGDVAELFGRLLLTEGGRGEVADADQLGHIDERDVHAGHVFHVIAHGHHAAIVFHHLHVIHVFFHVVAIVLHHLIAHATSEGIDIRGRRRRPSGLAR